MIKVHIQDCNGHRTVECSDEEDVDTAIGSVAFGGLYQIDGEIDGVDTSEFIPF